MLQLSLDLGIPAPELEDRLSEADFLKYYAYYQLKAEIQEEQIEAAKNG